LNDTKLQQSQPLNEQISKKLFYIFGHNISHSLSPTIHNAAFAELGLPHYYSIYQTPSIDDSVAELIKRPDFGGASVTFPHKLQVQPLLQSLSPSAQALGAVNTIVVETTSAGQQLRGDNTDWLGIRNCIKNSGVEQKGDHATILGSGGAARAACFALQNLGYARINLINRTAANAERLAKDFPAVKFNILESLAASPPTHIIVACIPADDLSPSDIPEHIFGEGGGVLIEMAYRPVVTALMQVASKHSGWKVVGGIDVLKQQAYAQFQLWTGEPAPVKVIEAALQKFQTGTGKK
jgi:shikimate-5-dehydrogenase